MSGNDHADHDPNTDPITLPVQVALTPDTVQVAHMLRVFARHLVAAADEIEDMLPPLPGRHAH